MEKEKINDRQEIISEIESFVQRINKIFDKGELIENEIIVFNFYITNLLSGIYFDIEIDELHKQIKKIFDYDNKKVMKYDKEIIYKFLIYLKNNYNNSNNHQSIIVFKEAIKNFKKDLDESNKN